MKKNLIDFRKKLCLYGFFLVLLHCNGMFAQTSSGVALNWNIQVGCQVYTEDPRKEKIYAEDIVDGECVRVCEYSNVIYTLTGLPPSPATTWTVSGGTISSQSASSVTISWGATGNGTIQFSTATDNGQLTKTLCIEIIKRPEALFNVFPADISDTPLEGCAKQTVYFTNLSNDNGGTDLVSYYWDFDDGSFSDAENPSHMFMDPGTYTVYLTVTNACNCKSTYKRAIVIKERGFEIICPSVVCDSQVDTYSLPEEALAACDGNYNWSVIGGEFVGNSNASTVSVNWNHVDESGFGYLTFDPSVCHVECPLATTIRIPVIQSIGTIQGDAILCLGAQGRYSLPQWPSTDFTWEILGNSAGTLATVLPTSQRNEVIITPLQAGTITLYATYQNTLLNCGGTATFTITVNNPAPFNGDSVVCKNATSVYTTVSGIPVNWTLENSVGTTISTLNNSNTFSYLFGTVGNFVLTVSGPGICDGQTKSITVLPELSAPVIDNPTLIVCPNAPYIYAVSNPDSNSQYIWEIANGNGSFVGSNIGTEVNVVFTANDQIKVRRERLAPQSCSSVTTTQNITVLQINADISNSPTNAVVTTIDACSNNTFIYKAVKTTGGTGIYTDPNSNYVWSILPNTAGSIASGQGTNTVSILWNNVLVPTNVTLQLVITNCTVVTTINKVITVRPVPTIEVTGDNSVCSGVPITFTVNPSLPLDPGTVINWNFGNGTAYNGPAGSLTTTQAFNNGTASNIGYTVTATITNPNSCSGTITASKNFVVTPGPNASASNSSSVNTFCNVSDISVTLTASTTTGATLQWYQNTASNPIGGQTGVTLAITPALGFGTYFFIATLNGCTTTSNNITIFQQCGPPPTCTVNPEPTVTMSATNNCGTITFVGAPSPTPQSTSWTISGPGVNLINVASNNGVDQYLLNVTKAGQYNAFFKASYTSTTGGLCTFYDNELVTVPYVPDFKFNVTCNNNTSFDVALTDNSDFLGTVINRLFKYEIATNAAGPWTTLSAFSSTSGYTITNQAPGNYFIRLTINGTLGTVQPDCQKVIPITLTAIPPLAISFIPPVCFDEAVEFSVPSVNPEDTFLWTFDNNTVQNTNPLPTRVFDPLLAGTTVTISVVITNKYGCSRTLTADVDIPVKCFNGDAVAIPGNATVCKGSAVQITYSPGPNECTPAQYIWMNGTTQVATTPGTNNSYPVTTAGFYWVKVVNAAGCIYETNERITPFFTTPPSLNLVGPANLCSGQTANIHAETDATVIAWVVDSVAQPGFDNQTDIQLPNLSIGNHTVSVTVTANGCSKTASQTITVAPSPSVPTIDPPVLIDCNNYEIKLVASASGTGTFTWSNGGQGDTIIVFEGGPYMVTFTNEAGCSESAQIDVPKSPKAYMWVFPTGCYDACDHNLGTLLGPNLPIAEWTWLQDGNPDSIGFNSIPADYPLTQAGTYQLELNTGLCALKSEPLELDVTECRKCPIKQIVVDKIKPIDGGPCSFTVTLIITSDYSVDFPVTATSSSNEVIIAPAGIILVPGTASYTFTVIPINGFAGGTTTLQFLGTFMSGEQYIECIYPFEITLDLCNSQVARPGDETAQDKDDMQNRNAMTLYPNPAQNEVNIQFDSVLENTQLEVYDLTGRLVASYQANELKGTWRLDLNPMATGVYVVVMRENNQIIMQKKLQVL